MTIAQHEFIPRLVPVNHNCIFGLLDNRWSNQNTQFSEIRLSEMYHLLVFPVNLVILNKGKIASSEEAFIIMLMKTVTRKTNMDLCAMFSEPNDAIISMIYHMMILLLDDKADGISHGNCLHCWSHLFHDFLRQLGINSISQYGEYWVPMYSKMDETCRPGSGFRPHAWQS
jgi:hypothetical protein